MRLVPSSSCASKFAVFALSVKCSTRHSTTNVRLGATPVVVVKMPWADGGGPTCPGGGTPPGQVPGLMGVGGGVSVSGGITVGGGVNVGWPTDTVGTGGGVRVGDATARGTAVGVSIVTIDCT